MPVTKRKLLVGGAAAVGLGTAGYRVARAQAQASQVIADLADKEGVYVDLKEYKVHKGRVSGKAAGQLAMGDAREVSEGAIIVRSGGKLYLVDTKPRDATPQAMKDFWDSIPLPLLP